MEGLPSVQQSINRLISAQAAQKAEIAGLSDLVWSLADLLGSAPVSALNSIADRMLEPNAKFDFACTKFAYALTLGRVLVIIGRDAEVRAWMDGTRKAFGYILAF